ncbi:MAG: RNA polymerase Rpb4 family protein [Candidatus Micrarchaeia archaeon]|jgi:DNA-directed RNA polymerase subunit F
MIGNEVKNSKDISLSEVLELLEKRKKRSALGYEQQTCYNYCELFSKLSLIDGKKMIEELKEIEKLNDKIAIKILDIMPVKENQLKIILAKERIELSTEEIQKVFEIILRYKEKAEEHLIKKQKKKAKSLEEKALQEKVLEEAKEEKPKKAEIKEEKPKKAEIKKEKPKEAKKEPKVKKAKKSDKK